MTAIKLEHVSTDRAVDFDGFPTTNSLSCHDVDLEISDLDSPWIKVSKGGEDLGLIPIANVRRVRLFTKAGRARMDAKGKAAKAGAPTAPTGHGPKLEAEPPPPPKAEDGKPACSHCDSGKYSKPSTIQYFEGRATPICHSCQRELPNAKKQEVKPK